MVYRCDWGSDVCSSEGGGGGGVGVCVVWHAMVGAEALVSRLSPGCLKARYWHAKRGHAREGQRVAEAGRR